MRAGIRLLLWAALLVALLQAPAGASVGEKRNILYLNSYHTGYLWSDHIQEGIRQVFAESGLFIDLQIEYLDAKKYAYPRMRQILTTLFQEKFHDKTFDVIIVSDDDALRFMLDEHESVFQGVPVVFCGVNDFQPESIHGQEVTGVVEDFDFAGNIKRALLLHRGIKRVIILGDESTTGVAIANQVRQQVGEFAGRLTFEFRNSLTLDQALNMARNLPPDALLYFIPIYQTQGDRSYSADEVLERLPAATKVPLYSNWEFLLGHGIVGGRLVSGYAHGRAAAGLALRILKGEKASDIPLIRGLTGDMVFDYKALKRHGIPESSLPEGSRLINEPPAFYQLGKELFWTIIGSLVLLSAVLVALVKNIAWHKAAEKALAESQSMLRLLLDTIPHLIYWKDRDLRYQVVNKPFMEFFGYLDPDQVLGKSDFEILRNPDHARRAIATDHLVMDSGQPQRRLNWSFQGPSGQFQWLEITKVPIRNAKDEVVGTLGTAEDVTQRVNLEKQLLQSQKMEAIGALAGGIAHDFNNILTSILNSAELAMLDLAPEDPTRPNLERVIRASLRGSRLVKQILAFSRPTQEGFQATDLAMVTREALGIIRAALPRNIVVDEQLLPAGAWCWADPTRLHQVVINLCTNAFQAMRPTGGRLRVELVTAQLDPDAATDLDLPAGGYLRLCIADTGPGITPELKDKIFDPFFTTKPVGEGTGLGLSVVLGIVKSHSGAITVHSAPGEGATFTIYLPARGGALKPAPRQELPPAQGQERVLFVEDDEDQLTAISQVLARLGYQVQACLGASAALDALRREPAGFDVLVTDFDMPDMDGVQLARSSVNLAPHLPVILVSGRIQPEANIQAPPNILLTLSKPYDGATLSNAIREVVDSQHPGRPSHESPGH